MPASKKHINNIVHWLAVTGVGLAALDVVDQAVHQASEGLAVDWRHGIAAIVFAVTKALRG